MKVSVWATAFNHEKYIRQCLDSVLMQKTDFDFEIIIGEDCSDDNTREILKKYKEKHPDKITLYLPEKNIGMMNMDIATKKLCRGKYLALLNGDDYWTDEKKLQIQCELLDREPETSMCYHKATVLNEDTGNSFETYFGEKENELPLESLLNGYNPVMTPTVMVRNNFELEDWYADLPYGDMPLYLMQAQKGKIRYIDRNMSVYRIHSSGNWQGNSAYSNLQKDLEFYSFMNEKLEFKYNEKIMRIFAFRYFELIKICINNGSYDEAKSYYEKLKLNHADVFNEKEVDMKSIHEILFNGCDKNNYSGLLSGQIQWKVN